jgi:hypothetical protein
MSAPHEIPAVLTLELRAAVHAGADRSRLGRTLRDAAREELDRLGLQGVPKVRMVVGDGSRAVRVRLRGTPVPYPPELLARVWQGVAPRELHPVALGGERNGAFPDAWLDAADGAVVADALAALTVALMRRRPDALLTTQEHEIAWGAILRPLIRLTGTLADRAAVGTAVLGAVQMGLPDEDVLESAFATLRDGSVGVLWPSGLPDWSADAAADLGRRLFGDLGVPIPAVRVIDGVGEDAARIEVVTAGVPGVAAATIGRDELLVEGTDLDGIEGTTIMHPVTGAAATVVPAGAREDVERAGLTPVDAKGLAIQLLARELQEQRRRLVSASEVEHQLALLRAKVPAVVGAAVALFPLTELSRIARLLVEDGISMADLKGSLDRLLDYEVSRPQRPLPLTEPPTARTNGAASHRPTAADYADAVRAARARGLSVAGGAVSVIDVDPELEARLASATRRERTVGVLGHEIRNATWSVCGALADDEKPVVLTSPSARRALRAVLADELPSLDVVSEEELTPDLARQVVGTIAL